MSFMGSLQSMYVGYEKHGHIKQLIFVDNINQQVRIYADIDDNLFTDSVLMLTG